MSDPDRTPSRAGAPRWMRLLLVASLAINLLVLGIVASAVASGGGSWRGHGGHGGGPMARALSDEDRSILRARMRDAKGDAGAARQAHGEGLQTLLTLLRATPYDGGAVAAQMQSLRGHFLQRMERGQSLLADRLAEMTDAERAAYADRLEEAMRRRPGH